jgi:hypothetical protein
MRGFCAKRKRKIIVERKTYNNKFKELNKFRCTTDTARSTLSPHETASLVQQYLVFKMFAVTCYLHII